MIFACFQLLGRIRANLMMLHLPPCKGIEDFAIEPWMTTPVQGFLIVVP